jgi:hypothetical protein
MISRRGAFAVALAGALGGCTARDTVARWRGGPAYCQGSSPTVLADGTCTGALAQRTFARAACTCSGGSFNADLVTDGFDARQGAWTSPGGSGGDVGAVGGLTAHGLLQVNGSLAVSGGAQVDSRLAVTGDLDLGGVLGLTGAAVTVGGSARIGGDVNVSSLAVAGMLTTPPGAARNGTISYGSSADGAVTVASPCPCDAAHAVDVAAIVAQHRTANDNAAFGLDPAVLSDVTTSTSLDVPCGRFYLTGIQGRAALTLHVIGRAALFVDGNVTLSAPFTITVDRDAALDLFIAGALNPSSTLQVGDARWPSAVRAWVAAGGTITMPTGAQLAANLYAPNADLVFSGATEAFGSLVVSRLNHAAALTIHHDRAIAEAGASCQ